MEQLARRLKKPQDALMRPGTYTALLLLLVFPMSLCAQSNVATAQKNLLKMTAAGMDTDVPVPVQQGIVALKQALVGSSDRIMQKLPVTASAAAAKAALQSGLPPESVGKEMPAGADGDTSSKPEPGAYGGSLTVNVQQPQPSLLMVQESFGIMCGDDTLLLVYRNEGGQWHRVLRWQSPVYKEISGAFGDVYETRVLQPLRNGHPLLLVIHGTPWCTSTMSGFAMDVFELGAPGDSPLWHGAHSYRRADELFKLKTTADGFEVRTSVSTFGEERDDRVSRTGIMRYAVRADGVHRTEPIAMNAAESLEEWLGMPRTEAAEFADDDALLRKLFETVTWHDRPDDPNRPTPGYGALHACRDNPKHFQMDVTLQHYVGSKTVQDATYYVQMFEVPNGYRMHSALQKPDASCGGPDLLQR